MPPDHALNPVNATWYYGIDNTTTQTVSFDIQTVITLTNANGDFFQVLSNMNDALGTGPYYRYESGTSMSAADVSGMLALMQEFFQQRLGRTNSPALMKALLINGARSLGVPYDFGVTNDPNFQGWGLVNLPTTIPGTLTNAGAPATSMLVFDQSPTNALATGQSFTRFFTVSTNAQTARVSMRLTLVWTDPPGNPVAGIKLVNNLGLIVTNLDTGEVFFGNDIQVGNTANLAWDTNTAPNLDVVNNVQNVYLGGPLGTNYSVTVVGRRVNVNAVSANLTNVVQDYALVISCGDGEVTNALALTRSGPVASVNLPYVTPVGNIFTNTPGMEGGILLHQHVGANSPLVGTNSIQYPVEGDAVITLGVTNQWHFYMVTNDNGYTNAAFMTFNSLTLTLPRMGPTNTLNPTNATRPEADIDLYVSTNPALTNLDAGAISECLEIGRARWRGDDCPDQCRPRRLLCRRQVRGPARRRIQLHGRVQPQPAEQRPERQPDSPRIPRAGRHPGRHARTPGPSPHLCCLPGSHQAPPGHRHQYHHPPVGGRPAGHSDPRRHPCRAQ